MKIYKACGPPGTGKTSWVLRQIERACEFTEPERIGAVSFTKAAVIEMQARVANTLGVSQAAAKNIRTIHSHCFRLLGLNKDQVVKEGSKWIKEWNEAYPKWCLPCKSSIEDLEDGQSLDTYDFNEEDNAKRLARANIYRGRGIPIESWHDEEAELFYRDWSHWLTENEIWDFPMMLSRVLELGLSPNIDVLFIDEAQDLSTVQIQVAKMWGERCEKVIFVGDEDQALYRFLGAVPEDFRNLETSDNPIILKHSYRVPRAVHAYAMELISQIKTRDPVEYLPTDEEGDVRRAFLPSLDLEGSNVILTRTNHHLKRWIKFLTQHGIPWKNDYRPGVKAWNPTSTQLWTAVRAYENLKRGLDIRGDDLVTMIKKMPSEALERGVKTHARKLVDQEIGPRTLLDIFRLSSQGWMKADFFNFTTPINKLFPLSGYSGDLIKAHGSEITRTEPTWQISTVHGFKGAEADHIHLDRSTSAMIMRAVMNGETALEDEIRISYVGVTRAKKTLTLLEPFGPAVPVWV